jgi:hypothetical protein
VKKALGWLVVLVLAAALGSFAGEIAVRLLPGGKLRDVLSAGFWAGFAPATLNLQILSLTAGMKLKISLSTALGAVVGGLVFYKFS